MSIYILSYLSYFDLAFLEGFPGGIQTCRGLGVTSNLYKLLWTGLYVFLQTQIKSLSATIGIRVPEVAVGGRWRPDLRAFGIPFTDNATQWGCPRCGANVFAWKPACFKSGKVCSKSWGLYPSPAPYEWHWCQWWCGSRVVWGGSPPPVICSTTTTTHTQHTDPPVSNRGSKSFWCAIDLCVWVGSVTASDPVDWVTVTNLCSYNLCQLRVLCSDTSIPRYIHIVIICRLSLHCFIYYNIHQSVSYPMFSIQVLSQLINSWLGHPNWNQRFFIQVLFN